MQGLRLGLVVVAIMGMLAGGCYTHTHIVGEGPQGGYSVSKKQFYLIFGLIPLNDVDTGNMARGASDYAISTQMSFVDGLVAALTYNLFGMRTVTVEKAAKAPKDQHAKQLRVQASALRYLKTVHAKTSSK